MRRSRSFSNIPLPKSRRNLSTENLSVQSSQQVARTSQQGARTSQQGLRKSVSSNNLFLTTRSALTVDSRENDILGSTNKNANRRITATPLRSIGSSSVCRRINATPLSHCKVAASPCNFLTTNLINDKKFSSDQFRKISAFLEDKLEVFDPKSLKPLSLASFVQIISVLFGEIDPRIKINMQNYKEVVFKYLKLYKYPGPVTMSLLKSVNTNISWTQVMSIFGWMVDLIGQMTSLPNEDLLEKYILHSAKDSCQSGIEKKGLYIEYIEELLNFDKREADMLENEFEMLSREAESTRTLISEQKEKKASLLEKLESMKSDIKEFKENNIEAEIENEIRKLQAENKMLAKDIDDLKQTFNEMQQTISDQKYSLSDKQELLKKLEDKNYSVSLRKEELQNLLMLKDDFDLRQTNCRRQIEKEIHEINGRLVELNLSNFIDARIIRLPDCGRVHPKFIEEIEQKKQLLIDIAKKIDVKFMETKKTLEIKEEHFGQLCGDVEKMKKDNDILKHKIEKIIVDINRVMFECDEYKKQQEKKNRNVQKIVAEIEAAKEKRIELQQELLRLKGENDKLNKFALQVSKDIYAQALNNATQIEEIKADLAEKALKALEKKVIQKRKIVQLLDENINE